MKIHNEIQPVEINGEDSFGVNEKRRLVVESHWNMRDRVHLKFGDMEITVIAEDLNRAVANACNQR